MHDISTSGNKMLFRILFLKLKYYHCNGYQEPITGSVQFAHFRATGFSQVGLFLDTPFPLKLLFPEACFVRFAEFCLEDGFEDEFDSSLRRGRRTGFFVWQIFF